MITLQRPDSKISAFLGENKGVRHGDTVRPSQFALPLKLGTRNVIFNTLTKQCIESKYFEWFESHAERIFDENNIEMLSLLKRDFLVASGLNEAELYAKLIKTIRVVEKPEPGYVGYTILPTTACNARCAYCFEQGIAFETMTDEVVEQTIRYIHATRRKDETISLHWFGGEPLMAEQIIERICTAMREVEVSYTSGIVTNGSLMNEELARKAKEEWNLTKAQITLDGREERYCEIKHYIAFPGSPYKAVLNGIHAMLDQGISVTIRLNVDDANLDEMIALTDELEEEFRQEGRISMYCHSIFAEEGMEYQNEEGFYEKMETLNERLYAFNRSRRENIQKEDEPRETEKDTENPYDRSGSLKRYYCMVDNPESGGVILPNGDICLCEHVGEVPIVSTVFDTTVLAREKYVRQGREKDKKCASCALLPICSDQKNCPTLSRDCYKEGISSVTRELRALEDERRLPPINIRIGDRIIRVTEPTAAFIDKYSYVMTDEYLNADESVSKEQAESIINETANNESCEEREIRLSKWATLEKALAEENRTLDPPEYMVLEDKKLAYLINSRVACSSIKAGMLEQELENDYTVHELADELKLVRSSLDNPHEYYVFTFVRNPFERLVSCYEGKYHTDIRSRKKRKNEFENYLDGYLREDKGFDMFIDKVCEIPWRLMDKHIKPQYNLVYDDDGRCRCSFIGKLENVDEEYEVIREKYGLKTLPHYNASYAVNWRNYYTPESAEKVYEKYRKDFENFGYEGSYEELLEFLRAQA